MHEKAFWSDKERVGRLAVERVDASKTLCERMRENETSASRKSGTSESRGVREYSAAQSNARLQAHETRGLSLSLDDQAESVSYATTCRLNRRNVTERYTARTDTWSDIIKDTVPFARSRSSPSIFASIFTNFAKSFSVRCVLESEKQYVVTKRS